MDSNWMKKRRAARDASDAAAAAASGSVSLLCVQDTLVGGVHYIKGDRAIVPQQEADTLLATGGWEPAA